MPPARPVNEIKMKYVKMRKGRNIPSFRISHMKQLLPPRIPPTKPPSPRTSPPYRVQSLRPYEASAACRMRRDVYIFRSVSKLVAEEPRSEVLALPMIISQTRLQRVASQLAVAHLASWSTFLLRSFISACRLE